MQMANASTPILSPTPIGVMNVMKRKSVEAHKTAKKSKTTVPAPAPIPVDTRNCHHCHHPRAEFVSCTLKRSKGRKTERCGRVFCDNCLKRYYDTSIATIEADGKVKDLTKVLGHDASENYFFKCPVCEQKCYCYIHRPKEGQAKDAKLEEFAKDAGLPVAEIAGILNGSQTRNKGKAKKEKTEEKPTKKEKRPKGEIIENKDKALKEPMPKPLKEKKPAIDSGAVTALKPSLAIGPPRPLLRKPKHVEDPNFEFIAISYPLPVIQARLRIREFVLRFEKKLNLIGKYMRIINDPNSNWTDLTYKNLIVRLLTIIQSDATPPLGPDLVYEAVKTIQATSADSPIIWTATKAVLESALELSPMEDIHSNEAYKLDLVSWLVELVITSTTIREQIDHGVMQEKKNHQTTIDEMKRLRAEWEEQRLKFQKERLLLPATDKLDFDQRYAAAQSAHKQLILQAEAREWIQNRKLTPRSVSLGQDILGNTYHLLHQRDQNEEDWGSWIVLQKGKDLPHPSGVLPPPPSMPSDNGMDPSAPEIPQPEDDEDAIRSRIWYCVDAPEDVHHLANWIKFKGEMAIYWQEYAKQQPSRPLTPASSVPGSPSLVSPSKRHLLEAVRVPTSAKRRQGVREQKVVHKEDYMPLVEKIKKIAALMEVARN